MMCFFLIYEIYHVCKKVETNMTITQFKKENFVGKTCGEFLLGLIFFLYPRGNHKFEFSIDLYLTWL